MPDKCLYFGLIFSFFAQCCFIGSPTPSVPTTPDPAAYNQLPPVAASPTNQTDASGSLLSTCGHSKYWNNGESLSIISGVDA